MLLGHLGLANPLGLGPGGERLGFGLGEGVPVGRFLGQAERAQADELGGLGLLELALVAHHVHVALLGLGKLVLGPATHAGVLGCPVVHSGALL